MWSRIVKIGTGVGAVLVTGSAIYYRDDIRLRAASVLVEPPPSYKESVYSQYHGNFDQLFPRSEWNSNWDMREPMMLVDQKEYLKADEAGRKEMLATVKPTATRHIFLIRHGQYILDSEKKNLTELGREQAQLLGKRLASADQKFDSVVMSTMQRATETATLMMEQMKPVTFKSDSILEEGAPYPPVPDHISWRPKFKFATDGLRIEAAFRKYIHRANVKQKEDSYELIVCHANVIRYFVCRALQFPPEGWLRMSLGNSSITWIVVRPNGYVSVRAIGDIGHLPRGKVSFT